MATAIVGGILAIIVGLVVYKMVKDKKNGKSVGGCGGDCAHCKAHCHELPGPNGPPPGEMRTSTPHLPPFFNENILPKGSDRPCPRL